MKPEAILKLRLQHQLLSASDLQTPESVVAYMGAIQSQDYAMALWATGMRMQEGTQARVEDAFNRGHIIRTHVLRPTWHFVAPADIRWMLQLSAPQVHRYLGTYYRKLEMDKALLRKSNKVLEKILRDHRYLNRAEIAAAMERSGINTEGLRLPNLLVYAELEALICSGPRIGKQFTYALLDERVPAAALLSREEALVRLACLYFGSRGPATVADFAWWSGLSKTEAATACQLIAEELQWLRYKEQDLAFIARDTPVPSLPSLLLLPNYDEYMVSYTDRELMMSLKPGTLSRDNNPLFSNTILVKGKVEGSWKRSIKGGVAAVQANPFQPFTAAGQKAWERGKRRFCRFVVAG